MVLHLRLVAIVYALVVLIISLMMKKQRFLLMNKKKWDSLTPEQQQIITEAAKEATVWQRAESVKLEKKAWDAFKAKGIEITMLTPEQRKELYDKTAPVREQFAKEIPAELLQLIADTQK